MAPSTRRDFIKKGSVGELNQRTYLVQWIVQEVPHKPQGTGPANSLPRRFCSKSEGPSGGQSQSKLRSS